MKGSSRKDKHGNLKQYFQNGGTFDAQGDKDKKKKKRGNQEPVEEVPFADFNFDKADPVPRPVTQSYQEEEFYTSATPVQKNLLDYKYNNRMYFDPESSTWKQIGDTGDAAFNNLAGFNDFMVGRSKPGGVGFKVSSFVNPETNKSVRVPSQVLHTQVGVSDTDYSSLFQ